MARDFDGTDDSITFGSDASIDGFALQSVALYMETDQTAAQACWLTKGTNTAPNWKLTQAGNLLWFRYWNGVVVRWRPDTTPITTGTLFHVVVTYDSGATTNDPVIVINGVTQTLTQIDVDGTAPVNDDSADTLRSGTQSDNSQDVNGRLLALCYDNTLWDAASMNRHRWWGVAPGGPSTVKVWHPFWTSDLNNRGTAIANGTATGTTLASLPRVERMWGSMMGCGR